MKWSVRSLLVGLASLVVIGCGGDSGSVAIMDVLLEGNSQPILTLWNGSSGSIEITDGSRLELRTSEPVEWLVELGSATSDSRDQSDTHLRLKLSRSGVEATESVLWARVKADPAASIRLTVRIAARRFEMRDRVIGEFSEWSSVTTATGGSPVVGSSYREEVFDSRRPDIVRVFQSRLEDGRMDSYADLDRQDNPVWVGRIYYDDSGMDYHATCEFEPPLPLFRFPLYVGESWRGEWTAVRCVDAAEGPGSTKGIVEAFETIDVPAGRFQALRIRVSISPAVDGVGLQQRAERVCWWATDLGRLIRCEVSLLDHVTGVPYAVTVTELLRSGRS